MPSRNHITSPPATAGNSLTKQKSEITKRLLQEKYANLRRMTAQNATRQNASEQEENSEHSSSSPSHQPRNFSDLYQSRMSIHDFEILKCIGKGGFGEVLLCRHKKTREIYAIKKLKKLEMTRRKQVGHVRAERDALIQVDSKWIVKLYYTFQDDVHLYFVMEYLPAGDLMGWLIKKQTFTEEETKFYIAELILAVEEIHKLKYVHRDLKPDNILLDARGHIKLTDFGLCKLLEIQEDSTSATMEGLPDSQQLNSSLEVSTDNPDSIARLNNSQKKELYQKNAKRRAQAYSVVGSSLYVSPEVLKRQGYSWETDFWSVGVIMFESLFGYSPFFADSQLQTCKKIVRWKHFIEFPVDTIPVSDAALDLMQHLLCDADQRVGVKYSVEEVKQHAFFQGIDWEHLHEQKAPFAVRLSSETDTRYFDEYDLSSVLQSIQSSKHSDKRFRRKREEDLLFEQFTFHRQAVPGGEKKKSSRRTVMDVFSLNQK